jgi:ornithine carbamoyltransferase
MPPKDFISIADWERGDLVAMLDRASELKARRARRERVESLQGRSVLLYFEKPSLRTYVTFGVGVSELGGTPIYLPPGQVQIGEREEIEDVARNLSRWCDAVVARTFSQKLIEDLARHATLAVINALSDRLHPCQAMADAMTVAEAGDLKQDLLVYVGDGNNVAHSLIHLAGVLGSRLTVCTPEGYRPDSAVVERGRALAAQSGAEIAYETDPRTALKDAAFVYTDVWTSMGQEAESERRRVAFQGFQINSELLAHARRDARVLHCLPAHRGEEITADVIESDASLVFDQAENRLHAQKAILEALLPAG